MLHELENTLSIAYNWLDVLEVVIGTLHGAFGASLRLPKEKKCETRVFR